LENQDPSLRLRCPVCKNDQFPDNLVANKDIRSKVEKFIQSYIDSLKPTASLESVKESETGINATTIEPKPRQKAFRIITDNASAQPSKPITAPKNAIATFISTESPSNSNKVFIIISCDYHF